MLSWLPENISLEGQEIDALFYVIYYITGATFILVAALMVWFLIAYRDKPGAKATYTHGNNMLEIAWTVIPALILVVLMFMSQTGWAHIKMNLPAKPDVRVEVTGKQFNWIVRYAGPDGKFGTADDVVRDNALHVPVGKKVLLTLKGVDVIHSFFVPALRLKQDILPGRETFFWFTATKTGTYEMPCAELCGFGHSGMNGKLTVHSEADYGEWIAKTYKK
ncbi:MAG: cytochrome c oxidase subunit II [bacterium]|nr:cytochrome c oxidase subunit II [bacterium]